MKRVLRICIFCMLLTLLSIPVYAGENQLENTADFLQETLQWMEAPLTVEISEEGETETLFTADPVEVEEDGFHGLALQIAGEEQKVLIGETLFAVEKDGEFYGLDLSSFAENPASLLETIQQTESYESLVKEFEDFIGLASEAVEITMLPSTDRNSLSFSIHCDGMFLGEVLRDQQRYPEFWQLLRQAGLQYPSMQLVDFLYRNGIVLDTTAILSFGDDRLTISANGVVSRRYYSETFDVFAQFGEPANGESQPWFRIKAVLGDNTFTLDGENGTTSGEINLDGRSYLLYGMYDLSSEEGMFSFDLTDAEDAEVVFTFNVHRTRQGLAVMLTGDEACWQLLFEKKENEKGTGKASEGTESNQETEYILKLNAPMGRFKTSFSSEGVHLKLSLSYYYGIETALDLSFQNPGIKGYYYNYSRRSFGGIDTYLGKLVLGSYDLVEKEDGRERRYDQRLYELTAESDEMNLKGYYFQDGEELLFDTATGLFAEPEGEKPELSVTVTRKDTELDVKFSPQGQIGHDLSIHKDTEDKKDAAPQRVKVQMVSLMEMLELWGLL